MRRGVAVLFSALLAGGVAATLVVALVTQADPAEAAFPGKNGRIAFVSDRPGSAYYDVYTMGSGGEDVRRLTNGKDAERGPAFSPDGQEIAYWGGGRRADILVMSADGSDKRRVTIERKLPGDPKWDDDPAFSPGGHRIVFVRGYGQRDSAYDLYAINESGTGLRLVFDSPAAHPRNPAWSPDGSRIAFEYDEQMATVRPDGTDFRVLRPGYAPDWSPDGGRIAFSTEGGIRTMRGDGSTVRQLSDAPGSRYWGEPAYSPGGGRLAFTDYRDGQGKIYTIGVDGTAKQRLTRNEAQDNEPTWQPVR